MLERVLASQSVVGAIFFFVLRLHLWLTNPPLVVVLSPMSLCLQGAYCSNACGKRSDPASIPCYVCGRVISGPYTIESAGSKVGCRKHPHCFPSRRQMAAGGRK